ncbi:C-factor [Streptomyces sp. MBT84]|nr:C-factor [Streptomyces sp. MBT84]
MIHETLPLLRCSENPRIVNVSSTTASFALSSAGTDLGGDADHRIAYATSKAALNMVTVQYARAFAADPQLAHIKINSVTPGYVATDMNEGEGHRSIAEGARGIIKFATAAGHEGTGGFHNEQGTVPW